MSDWGPWARILVRHAAPPFESQARVDADWRALNFTAAPDYRAASRHHDAFIEILQSAAPVHVIDRSPEGLTLDAIYVRDASIVTPRGAILCRMGKAARQSEPGALAEEYTSLGVPILGTIKPPGQFEGGDFTWLGPRVAAVGRGYRTNTAGIEQLRALLAGDVDELIVVPLPHYRGPDDVFHLMSIVSPVDRDLAVVYSPLMPVPFRQRLLDLGFTLVEVPDDEFETMGANVFAMAPRRAVMVGGNPKTRAALERAGADVAVYDGSEISAKGCGGPTCLTRPLPSAVEQGIGAGRHACITSHHNGASGST